MVGSLPDVITYAKFQVEIFRLWVTILQGVEFSIFLLIFAWALQQSSDTALRVMQITHTVTVTSQNIVDAALVRNTT